MMHVLTDRVLSWWSGLPPNDRRALTIVIVFLSVVFGYVWFIEPLLQRYDAAQAALIDLEDQERRYTRQVTMLARREAKLAEHRTELTNLQNTFKLVATSQEAAVSRSINELSYYARLTNVNVNAVRPMEPQIGERYVEIPMEAEAIGSYEALQRFFYYVDTSPSLLALTDLDLRADEQGPLQARLKVSAITRSPGSDKASPVPRASKLNRLQLVVSHWTGNAPMAVAKAQGYLDTDDISIDLLALDDNVTAERLLLSGEVDGIVTGLPELLNFWVKGLPLKVVLPLDQTKGTEAVMTPSGSAIKSVADLNGRDIAVDTDGSLKLVLYQALQQANLNLDSVKLRPLGPGQVARELVSGTIDVGVTREPFLSSLLNEGQGTVLYSSAGSSDGISDLLTISPDALTKKRKALLLLLNGVLKAERFIAEQPEAAAEQVAHWQGRNVTATLDVLKKLKFFDNNSTTSFFAGEDLKKKLGDLASAYETMRQPFPLVTETDLVEPALFKEVTAP